MFFFLATELKELEAAGCPLTNLSGSKAACHLINDRQQQHIQGGHLLIFPEEYDSAPSDSENSDINGGYYTESAVQLHDRCRGNRMRNFILYAILLF